MKFFETHAHYDDIKFEDEEDEVLKEVINAGVDKIVNVACDYSSCITSFNLSEKYDFIYFTIGVHPFEAETFDINKLEYIYSKVDKTKLVAIGEIGLDYSYDYVDDENKKLQQRVFIEQIKFAHKYNLPIIIHTRDASYDTFEILRKYTTEDDYVLLHCFSPTDDLVNILLERKNYMCAFGGNITYKRKDSFEKYLEKIPMEKIVLETDSPYLPPQEKRGTRNDSSSLPIIAAKLAEFKKLDVEEIAKITYNNAMKFYKIK